MIKFAGRKFTIRIGPSWLNPGDTVGGPKSGADYCVDPETLQRLAARSDFEVPKKRAARAPKPAEVDNG